MLNEQEFIRKNFEELKARGATMVTFGEKLKDGMPTGRRVIVVGVQKKLPLSQLRKQDIIPDSLKGIETDVVEFEPPTILPKLTVAGGVRTSRQRPAFGGISVGHPNITAGTLGGLVWKDGQRYGITNWHVGNMNDGKIGDPMWQPGPYDGGGTIDFLGPIALKPDVIIGGLPDEDSNCSWFGAAAKFLNALGSLVGSRTRVKIIRPKAEAQDLVDMCLIGPLTEAKIIQHIYEIGYLDSRDWCELQAGDVVKKSGRTTGVTSSTVQSVGASVRIGLGGTLYADFHDQVIFGYMCDGGDSGSLIIRQSDKKIGALLFAGSSTNTIGNRWLNVINAGKLDC